MHHPTDRISHTTAFVKPVVEHWLTEKETSVALKSEATLGVSSAASFTPHSTTRISAFICISCGALAKTYEPSSNYEQSGKGVGGGGCWVLNTLVGANFVIND